MLFQLHENGLGDNPTDTLEGATLAGTAPAHTHCHVERPVAHPRVSTWWRCLAVPPSLHHLLPNSSRSAASMTSAVVPTLSATEAQQPRFRLRNTTSFTRPSARTFYIQACAPAQAPKPCQHAGPTPREPSSRCWWSLPARSLAGDNHTPLLLPETHSSFVNSALPSTSTTGFLHAHRRSPTRSIESLGL